MRRLITRNNAIILLAVLVIIQFGLSGYQWLHQKHIDNLYNGEITSLQQSTTSANNSLSYQQVTVSPSEKKIYLPRLSLVLPLTTLGTSLVYSPDIAYVSRSHLTPSGAPDEASISTFSTAGAPQSQTQFDCSSLVRIKFEAKPDPYNPSEVPSGSVALANGKTLQIYASHLKACHLEWSMAHVNTDTIASLFKQAQSY